MSLDYSTKIKTDKLYYPGNLVVTLDNCHALSITPGWLVSLTSTFTVLAEYPQSSARKIKFPHIFYNVQPKIRKVRLGKNFLHIFYNKNSAG